MEDHQVGKTLNKKQSCLQGSTPTGKTSEHQMEPAKILSVLLLFGLILLFFIILFIWIVSILKLPDSGTRPPEFKVDQVVVFQFNIRSSHLDTLSVVTSSHLDSKSIVTFSVKNPNSYRSENIYCEDVMASVLYKDVNISSVRIEPFLLIKIKGFRYRQLWAPPRCLSRAPILQTPLWQICRVVLWISLS